MNAKKLFQSVVAIAFTALVVGAQDNWIKNPSFEDGLAPDGKPVGWGYHCTGASHAGITTDNPYDGNHCGYIHKVVDGTSHVAALAQSHKVEPNTEYMLSAMVRGEGVLFGYEYGENKKWIRCAPGKKSNSTSWTPVCVKFTTAHETVEYVVRFELYGKEYQGDGWIDQVVFGKAMPSPLPPENLVLTKEGPDCKLQWQPSKTKDVAYYVFRSRYPDVVIGLEPIGKTMDTTFIDEAIPADWGQVSYIVSSCNIFHDVSPVPPKASICLNPDMTPTIVAFADSVLNKHRRYQPIPQSVGSDNLDITLAKNEVEAQQIVVFAKGAPIQNLAVKATEIFDASGKQADVKHINVKILTARYTTVRDTTCDPALKRPTGLFADALPPYKEPVDVPADANQSFWVQIQTAPDCPAGNYKASVEITAAGNYKKTFPLSIQVYDFQIPITPTFMSAFAVWPNFIAQAHQVERDSEEFHKLRDQYYWFITERRLGAGAVPVSIFSPEAHKYLDNPLVRSFSIPAPWGKVEKDELKKTVDHIKQNGWFHKAYLYIDDEPPPERYPAIIEQSKQAHEAVSDIPYLMTVQPTEKLFGHIDIWCPVLSSVQWEDCDKRRELGERLWWYTCCGPRAPYPTYLIDDYGSSHCVLSWLQAKHQVEGVLYWCVNVCTKYRNGKYQQEVEVWDEAELFPHANGDGFLVYPGKQVGIDGPVTSMRLEIIRDGNEDVEYFNIYRKLLAKKDNAQEMLEEIIHPVIVDFKNWTKDPQVIEKQRRILAQEILKLK
ncbi:MAG: Carbohydrate binding domain protein [Lentisphaerae bacterium ADurb.Bin082]|nr:MAG: Carbohydrate binding domain protein [Lentisphaerae bacterium ADurb.Bin082]HQL88244.1 DUF6067 family protein [Lentisphaeria bacterium]